MQKMWLYNKETKLLYRVLEIKRDKLTTLHLQAEDTGIKFEQNIAVKEDGSFDFGVLKRSGYDLITEAKAKELGLKIKDE